MLDVCWYRISSDATNPWAVVAVDRHGGCALGSDRDACAAGFRVTKATAPMQARAARAASQPLLMVDRALREHSLLDPRPELARESALTKAGREDEMTDEKNSW